MSRTQILSTGAIAYRTRNMDLTRAAAFARCIEANAIRFRDVVICEAHTATPQYYVQFRPSSVKRQADLYQSEWDKNQRRADAEGADYVYADDPDNMGTTWVFNPHSGETYQMFQGHCQCPHKLFRCTAAGLLCKHEMEKHRRTEAARPTQITTESREARNARMAANVVRDF